MSIILRQLRQMATDQKSLLMLFVVVMGRLGWIVKPFTAYMGAPKNTVCSTEGGPLKCSVVKKSSSPPPPPLSQTINNDLSLEQNGL